MPNVMQMQNGGLIKIVDRTNGQTTTDVREIGSKEKRFLKDVLITNVIKIPNG